MIGPGLEHTMTTIEITTINLKQILNTPEKVVARIEASRELRKSGFRYVREVVDPEDAWFGDGRRSPASRKRDWLDEISSGREVWPS